MSNDTDFCTSGEASSTNASPDQSVMKMMSHTTIDPMVYEYYIGGCQGQGPSDPLKGVQDVQSQLANWTLEYETFLATSFPSKTKDYGTLCGEASTSTSTSSLEEATNTSSDNNNDFLVFEAKLKEPLWSMEQMAGASSIIQSSIDCRNVIHPLYESATYDTFCTVGSNRIIGVMLCLGVSSILSLLMITFRVVPKLEFQSMIEIRDMLDECDRAYARAACFKNDQIVAAAQKKNMERTRSSRNGSTLPYGDDDNGDDDNGEDSPQDRIGIAPREEDPPFFVAAVEEGEDDNGNESDDSSVLSRDYYHNSVSGNSSEEEDDIDNGNASDDSSVLSHDYYHELLSHNNYHVPVSHNYYHHNSDSENSSEESV
jgi:hypothetical protein